MEKDLISIIVPCYNSGAFVEDCLKSIANQTYENYEVICINDGSKDNTLDVLKSFCEKNPKFKYFDQENKGLSGARNSGIAQAKGEFIAFIDSDDYYAPNYLEILRSIMTDDMDFSCCKFKSIKESCNYGDIKFKSPKQKTTVYEGAEDLTVQLLSSKVFTFVVWNKLYRTATLQKMEGYPNVFDKQIVYGEDVEYNTRFLSLCNRGGYTPSELYFYKIRKGSLFHSKFNEKMFAIYKGYEKNIKQFENKMPKVYTYLRANLCMVAYEHLFRMYSGKYDNSENIVNLYKTAKENEKYLRKATKIQWYKRLSPLSPIVLRPLLNKHFKKVKKNRKVQGEE